MRSKQVTAVFLSILLAASACVPLNGATAYAAESVEAVQEEDTAAQDPAPEQLSDVPEEQSPEEVEADEAAMEDEASDEDEAAGRTGEAVTTEAGDEESADVAGEAATAETDEADSAEADADAEEADDAESVGTETAEAADDAEALETAGEDEAAASSETSRASDEDGRSDRAEIPEIIYGDGVTDGAAREPVSAANSSVTADDIYSMTIIPTDVTEPSEGCVLAAVPGKYVSDPTSALARINEIRLEACKEGVVNPSTGKKLTRSDYVPIKWSRDMEYIARIRAAESSYTGNHVRTSDASCWDIESPDGYGAGGEVLAWNWSSSMTMGIEQWYGEKEDWVNKTPGAVTGHYTSMIDPSNRYVGLGTFLSVNSCFYNTTAGEFCSGSGLNESHMSFTGDCLQILEMDIGYLNASGRIIGKLYGARGEKSRHVLVTETNYGFASGDVYLMGGLNWSSSNKDVVTIDNDGVTTVVKGGRSRISAASADGKVTGVAPFLVKEIQDCTITLSASSFKYDGKEKKPAVTVTYKNKEITNGTDYTVKYSNNIKVGTATVTVTGKGQFSGADTKNFEITKGDQNLSFNETLVVPVGRKKSFALSGARGAVTVLAQDTEAADITYSSGNLVVTGKQYGSVKITVRAKETSTYNASEAEFEVQVAPAASAKVTIYNVAQGLKVTWLKVEGANRYNVYRDGKLIKTTSVLEITDGEVKYRSGEKFTYKVVATVKGLGESPLGRTGTYYRLMPVGIKSVTSPAAGKMTVTYDKSAGSSGYVVRYGLKSDMSDAKVITVKGEDTLSRTFNNLTAGKTYYVQVRTYKIDNGIRYYSGYCTTKTVTIRR